MDPLSGILITFCVMAFHAVLSAQTRHDVKTEDIAVHTGTFEDVLELSEKYHVQPI